MIEESSNVEQLLVIGPETACQSSSMPSMPAICPAPRIPGTERQGEGADQVVSAMLRLRATRITLQVCGVSLKQ